MPTPDEVTAALANWRAWQQHHADDVWWFSNGNPARSMEASMTLADDYPRLLAVNARLREACETWRDTRERKSLTDRVYEVEEWNRLNREEGAALERIAAALGAQP